MKKIFQKIKTPGCWSLCNIPEKKRNSEERFAAVFQQTKQHEIIANIIVTAVYLGSVVILMLGFSYASIPLYQIYCQASGFGGTTQKWELQGHKKSSQELSSASTEGISAMAKKEKTSSITTDISSTQGIHGKNLPKPKELWINFNADTSENLPWTFKPTLKKLKVYPGDTALTFYIAQNLTENAISGISTYHVTPEKVGIYFNKIQCFCFEEQRLKAHESIEMPVLFFIDPDFEKDPKMKDVDRITLSYTFYRSSFDFEGPLKK